jgi:hypothetical protein
MGMSFASYFLTNSTCSSLICVDEGEMARIWAHGK